MLGGVSNVGSQVCRCEWLEVELEVLVEVRVGRFQAAALELWDPTLRFGGHCGQGLAWPGYGSLGEG